MKRGTQIWDVFITSGSMIAKSTDRALTVIKIYICRCKIRLLVQDVKALERKLTTTHADEDDERRALEEDITGKVSSISKASVVRSVWRTHTVDFTGVLARDPFGNRASRRKGKLTHPFPEL